MAETLETLIGRVYYIESLSFFWSISRVYLRKNFLLDKATDPSKTKDGVDYTSPVCDRINLDLDG